MSVSKNYIYNLIYQVTILLTPFITTPYLARVLGSDGIGISAFTDSVIQYFILFGSFGLNGLYSTRTIAFVRDDVSKRTQTFWELFLLKLVTITFTLIFFIASLVYLSPKYYIFFLLQSINVLAALFDISWFFMGLEDFKKTVTRNMIVKIGGIILVFALVKQFEDLWIFISILVISNLLGNISLWLYLPRYLDKTKPNIHNFKQHLLLTFKLFIPQIAGQIYLILDKTMVGIFSTESEVGFYDLASRITKVILTIVTSTSIVMLPKVSNLISKGSMKEAQSYIYKSFQFAGYMAIPLAIGLVGMSPEFIPWFLGDGFEKVILLITIIAPIMLAIAWSNVTGIQLMIPAGKEKHLTISICLAALLNFGFNLVLIPKLMSVGAAISTVIAEVSVIICQLILIRKIIPLKGMFFELWKFIIASLLMFLAIRLIGSSMGAGIPTSIIQIIIADLVYVGTLLLLKSEINLMVLNKFKAIILKRG